MLSSLLLGINSVCFWSPDGISGFAAWLVSVHALVIKRIRTKNCHDSTQTQACMQIGGAIEILVARLEEERHLTLKGVPKKKINKLA